MASIFNSYARLATRHAVGFRIAPRILIGGGLGSGMCAGAMLMRSHPIQFDSRLSDTDAPVSPPRQREVVSHKTVQQLANGSIIGLTSGFIVALFSRTLVFLGGLLVGTFHLASRNGLDVTRLLGINQSLIEHSTLLSGFTSSPWFTSSFLVTFILAAFVHL